MIVTGASTSGCVRATAVDALQHGYRTTVPREAVGDRNPAAHEANLYDIDAKYGDVVAVDEVLEQLGATGGGAGAMIVLDRGDAWQVVLQTDHADLSGDARAGLGRPRARATPRSRWPPRATTTAGRSGSARRGSTPTGRPVNFLDVDVTSHLAFYRAGIAAITEQDPYAGLLVSMHGAGIYRQRYGRDPALGLSRAAEVQELVDAFVAEQEASHDGASRRDGCLRRRPLARLRAAPDLRPALAALLHARRRGEPTQRRVPGLPDRAARALAVKLEPFPFEDGARALLARPAADPEGAGRPDRRAGPRRSAASTMRVEQLTNREPPAPVVHSSTMPTARTGEPYAGSTRSGKP